MAAGPAIITGIKTAATVLSAVGAARSLFSSTPKLPQAAEQQAETPTVMPTEDSQAVAEAKRRSLIAQVTRGGRASTVLTDTETFGGN